MSVHENQTQSATAAAQFDVPNADAAREAESAIAAFLLALAEVGDYVVPSNTYRAVVTRRGLEVEVFDDGTPSTVVTHYGTAAPVEEVAEFLGEKASLAAAELDGLPTDTTVWDEGGDPWVKGLEEWRWADGLLEHTSAELVVSFGPIRARAS